MNEEKQHGMPFKKGFRLGVVVLSILLVGSMIVACAAKAGVGAGTNKPSEKEQVWSPVFDEEMESTFRWFWENANSDPSSPGYGLMPDDLLNKWNKASSTGTGFALTVYGVGVENGWITRDEGYERALGTMKTLLNTAANENGWFYHFLEEDTGARFSDTEMSTIDQFLTISGVLFAGEYFGGEVQELAQQIYERVDWTWMYNEDEKKFHMAWSPEDSFSEYYCGDYAEYLGLFFLAAGSPTHPVGGEAYENITKSTGSYMGYPDFIMTEPYNQLFTYQFSHAWYDFRNKTDRDGDNFYLNSVIASLVSRQFSIDNQSVVSTFNENSWGLTPSDGPYGYAVYGASVNSSIDGTIPPCGPAGSAPFTAKHVKNALEYMRGIDGLWNDQYGFYDAYNTAFGDGWMSQNMYNIDKGITVLMLENLKSGLVWNYMDQNRYVQAGMKQCGFTTENTYMVDDVDANRMSSGFTANGCTLETTDHASQGTAGYQVTGNGTLRTEFVAAEPNADYMGAFRMDATGHGRVTLRLIDATGHEIYTSDATTVDSDDFTTISFDLTGKKDEISGVKTIELTFDGDGSFYLDEIQFTANNGSVTYAVIDERPYLGKEVGVEFDYYDPNGGEAPLYAYQWYTADDYSGHYEPIQGATAATYTPDEAAVGKFLRVEVTPVDAKGGSRGASCVSTPSSIVTNEVPTSDKFTRRTLKDMLDKGAPDMTDGDTMSVLNKWEDATGFVYDIQYPADESTLTINFNKSGEDWPSMFRYIRAADLSKYNRLDFTVKGTSAFNLMLESQSYDTQEIRVYPTENEQTYSWDLSDSKDFLSALSRIMLFAGPGSNSESGTIEFSKIEFNVEPATGDHVIKTGGDNIAVTTYDGKSDPFDVNKGWYSNDSGVYIIKDGTGEEKNVTYTKPGTTEYSYMYTNVAGDLSKFKKAVLELKGTKGREATIMIFGNKADNPEETWQVETRFNFTGSNDVAEIDMSGLPAADLNHLSKVEIYADPGMNTDSTGSFTIQKAYFSTQAYTGGTVGGGGGGLFTGSNFDALANGHFWQESNIYTISGNTVRWSAKQPWSELQYVLDQSLSLANCKYFVIQASGTPGQKVQIKLRTPDGDTWLCEPELTASLQTYYLELPAEIKALSGVGNIILYPGADLATAGTLTIAKMSFTDKPVEGIALSAGGGTAKPEIYPTFFDVLKDGHYWQAGTTFATTATTKKVSWNYKEPWAELQLALDQPIGLTNCKYLVMHASGVPGQSVQIKLRAKDGDVWLTQPVLTEQEQTYCLPLTDEIIALNGITSVVLYPGADLRAAGWMTINEMYFTDTPVNGIDPNASQKPKPIQYPGSYKILENGHFWRPDNTPFAIDGKAVYWEKKEAWAAMQYVLDDSIGLTNCKYFVLKVRGQDGQKMQIQLRTKDGDTWLCEPTFDGEVQTFCLPLTDEIRGLSGIGNIILYPGANIGAGGYVVFYEMYFSDYLVGGLDPTKPLPDRHPAQFDILANGHYWQDDTKNIYTINGNNITWKAKSNWDVLQYVLDKTLALDKTEYFVFKASGTPGQKVQIKLRNASGEFWLCESTLAAEEQTFCVPLTAEIKALTGVNALILYPGADATAAGSLTLSEMRFTTTKPDIPEPTPTPVPAPKELDVLAGGHYWQGGSVYTINGNTVTWGAKAEWDELQYVLNESIGLANTKYFVFKAAGTPGQSVQFKLRTANGDTYLYETALTDKEQTFCVELTDEMKALSGMGNLILYPGANSTEAGSLTISEMRFTTTKPDVPEPTPTPTPTTEPTPKPEPSPDEFDVLANGHYWQGGSTYTIDGSTVTWGGKAEWDELQYVLNESIGLANTKYFVFKAAGTPGQAVQIKLRTAAGDTWLCEHTLAAAEQTFSVELGDDIRALTGMGNIILYPGANSTEAGSLTISEMRFTTTKPDVPEPMPTPTPTTEPTPKPEPSPDEFDVLANGHYWQGGSTYTIDGGTVTWGGKAEWDELQYVLNESIGLANTKYFVFKAAGTPGQSVQFKLRTSDGDTFLCEETLAASEQTFCVELTDEMKALTGMGNLILYPGANNTEAGSLTISEIRFTTTNPIPEELDILANGSYWQAGAVYAIDGNTIAWDSKSEWDELQYVLSKSIGLANTKYFVFKATGTPGQAVQIKLRTAAGDTWLCEHTLAAAEQTFSVELGDDIRALTGMGNIILYPGANSTEAGSLTISEMRFTAAQPEEQPAPVEQAQDLLAIGEEPTPPVDAAPAIQDILINEGGSFPTPLKLPLFFPEKSPAEEPTNSEDSISEPETAPSPVPTGEPAVSESGTVDSTETVDSGAEPIATEEPSVAEDSTVAEAATAENVTEVSSSEVTSDTGSQS